MKRVEQHLTDAAGKRLLRQLIEPSGWTLNQPESGNDYGVDFDVEVFESGVSTGTTFKIQLKSSEHADESSDGSFSSVLVDRAHVEYWLALSVPLALVVADLSKGRVLWTLPQTDPQLAERLTQQKGQGAFTIRVPSSQHLSNGVSGLREALRHAAIFLSLESLRHASLYTFAQGSRFLSDPHATIRAFDQKANALRLDQADRAFRAGNRGRASALLGGVRLEESSEPGQRFSAILLKEKLDSASSARNGGQGSDIAQITLNAARQLREAAPRDAPQMRLFAAICEKAAELDVLIEKQLLLVGLLRSFPHDLAAGLRYARLSERIRWKHRHAIALVRFALASKHGWFQSHPILRLAQVLPMMSLRARFVGARGVAAAFDATALELCRVAVHLASQIDREQLCFAAAVALSVDHRPGSAARLWADGIAADLDPDQRARYDQIVDRTTRRHAGESLEGDIQTSQEQLFHNIRRALDPGEDT